MNAVRFGDDVTAFRARVEPMLLEHEAENNLLFGILAGMGERTIPGVLLATFEGSGPPVVALRTPPWPLVISYADQTAAASFAETLAEHGIDLPGVNGLARAATAFADAWVARTGAKSRLTMSTQIYRLEQLRPPPPVPGALRRAGERDLPLVAEWFDAFTVEAVPSEEPRADEEQVRRRLADPNGGLFLWEHSEQPVSLVGCGGPSPNGIRIGPVYTPPERRRRGYAAAATAALSAQLLAAGRRFCFLYTDRANPTSNALYQRLGYEHIADAAVYHFDAAT